MSKKTATIIISIFVLLIAGGFLAFYFYSNRGQGSNLLTTDTRENIFPTDSSGGGSPSGQNGTSGGNSTGSNQPRPETTEIKRAPVLKELSMRPSAGAVALATTSSLRVRFIEKGSGNVYEVSPENDAEDRLSNTTIPKIEESLWNKDGVHSISRYTGDDSDSIKTYSATLAQKSSTDPEGALTGAFLADNIRSIATNPDQNKIFYLMLSSAGSVGIVSDFDGSKKSQVFDSPLQDWLVNWTTPNLISLNTKPSSGIPGYLFLLNTQNGKLTQAISGVNGLMSLVNPDATLALYSETTSQGLSLKIYSFKDASIKDTAILTLPEKCIWARNDVGTIYCSVPNYLPDGAYPDDWYRGQIQFSDEIWKIDSKTGAGQLLANLKTSSNQDIDGTNLFLSPKEDYLFFTNKKDFHLWSLRLLP